MGAGWRGVGLLGIFDLGFADPDAVAILKLRRCHEPRAIEITAVGAPQIAQPKRVAALAHLGMQARGEGIFDAQIIARRAANGGAQARQFSNGIAVGWGSSDNQTWHSMGAISAFT